MEFAAYKDRVYFGNGVNQPGVYDLGDSYGGNAFVVPKTKVMGAQPPATAPTGTAVAGAGVADGSYKYKVTYMYYGFEESNGSTASSIITTAGPNNQVNLTIPTVTTLYGVTARKIYRAIGPSYDVYTLVGTVSDNTTTTFSDNTTIGTLPIPTDNNVPPVFGLIVNHLDRLWVAGVNDSQSTIYWSEAGLPDVFSAFNFLLCNPKDPIQGLYVYNDRVIVFNKNSMGQILGRTSADFKYSEISPSVGCADNRSIQSRTIQGVPTLIWLSTIGPYEFNGSSINQIGEDIENLFKLNIQQATQVKGKNSESAFTSGTPSEGIERSGGRLTTPNPQKEWDDQVEWEETNAAYVTVATKDAGDIKVPLATSPAYSTGTSSNTVVSGSNLQIPTQANFTGETTSRYTQINLTASRKIMATPIIPTVSGTMTQINLDFTGWHITYSDLENPANFSVRLRVYGDSAGTPSGDLYVGPLIPTGSATGIESVSIPMTGGQRYWIAWECNPSAGFWTKIPMRMHPSISIPGPWIASGGWGLAGTTGGGSWVPMGTTGNANTAFAYNYSYVANAIAGSGIWYSPVYDSKALNAVPTTVTHTASFPSGTSTVTTVATCSNGNFSSPTAYSEQTFANLNGVGTITTITPQRYWLIKVQIVSTDNRYTATVNPVTLKFTQTVQWTSAPINHNAPEFAGIAGHDVLTLDSLTYTGTAPGGTSVTLEVATSADNITYSSYTDRTLATPNKWSKVRVTLSSDAANVTTPTVSRLEYTWTLRSTFVSSVIDTGAVPAGWELFQTDAIDNGGTLLFEFKSAASVPGLVGATWYTVTNGEFIAVPAYQYAQWRVTITSTNTHLPTVDSITINWFIQTATSIRVASLFYDKNYYLAAAEYGNTTNNVVFMYDQDSNWKFFRGLTINTFCTFFTDAYYGSSLVGQIVKFIASNTVGNNTDQGTNIAMDMRTKAFSRELMSEEKTKYLRQVILRGLGTGARLTPTYSIDGGTTYLPLVDIETGLQYVDTINDGKIFSRRFSIMPTTKVDGKTIILRVYNNDEYGVEIHTIRAKCWISDREVLNG
jgi:hypothetical protein